MGDLVIEQCDALDGTVDGIVSLLRSLGFWVLNH